MNYKTLKTMNFLIFQVLAVLNFSSCEFKNQKSESSSLTSASPELRELISNRCVSCHSGANAPSGFSFVTDEAQMIASGYINPGSPSDSLIYEKLLVTPPFGARMPKDGPYLTTEEMQLFSDWISNINLSPSLAITYPSNNSYIDSSNNSASFTISGSCNVKDSTVNVLVNSTLTGTTATCDGTNFVISVDSTASPFILGQNTITAKMVKASVGIDYSSTVISVTKDLTSLAITLTSPSNASTASRIASASDSSLIHSGNVSSYTVAGTCNRAAQTVSIKVDGSVFTTTTCDGTNFTTNLNTTSLADGNHKFEAFLTDAGGNVVLTNAATYVYKWAAATTVSFSTDIVPLLTTPRGTSKACIECHFKKTSGNASASFSMGSWFSCPSGGRPDASGLNCTNTQTGFTTPESLAFVFKLSYAQYTSTTTASNTTGAGYANEALTIVNDRTEGANRVANRIVRGNPNQSFLYKKLTAANSTCYNGILGDGTTLVNCSTTQPGSHGQMPNAGPTYFSGGELTTIQTWITEGARTDN